MRANTLFLSRAAAVLLGLLAGLSSCLGQQAPTTAAAPPPDEPPSPAVQAASRQIADLAARISKVQATGPGTAPRAYAVDLPIAKFGLEKASLFLQQAQLYLAGDTQYAVRAIDQAKQALDLLAAGRTAYQGMAGLQERAYIAQADGSVQPYWVYVPKGKMPRGGWPVLVYLHGYVPDTSKINPWLPGDEFYKLSEEKGFMVAIPYGRRNTDFEGIGEQDVLTVINEVKRYYTVDPDRVFLGGPSMGAYGVYVIGLHHPDLFAGLAPMAGRSIPFVIEQGYPDKVPPFKRIAAESNTPIALVENAKHLPIFLQQGELDYLINPEHSRRLVAKWKALGYPITYNEWQGHDHYIYWEMKSHEAVYDWCAKQKRVANPREVVYVTYTPKYGRCYWTTIQGIEQWGKPARIQARIEAGNRIVVTTANVAAYSVTPPAALVTAGKPLTLVTNGHAETRDAWQPGQPLSVAVSPAATGLAKSASLCGPVRETFFSRFLLVPGTQGDADTKARLAEWAKRWATEWRAFADGDPLVKNDTAVTPEEMRTHHLVLFGDRRSNAILARIAAQLPVERTATGFRVGKEETTAENVGLLMTYPNPLAPNRLVTVYSGEFWGDGLDINHKFDLVPDFIIYRNELDGDDPARTPKPVVAGYFDSHWQLAPDLTWRP